MAHDKKNVFSLDLKITKFGEYLTEIGDAFWQFM